MSSYRNFKASKINVVFDRKNVIRIGILIMAISMAFLSSVNSVRVYALGDIGSYSLVSENATTSGQGGNQNSGASGAFILSQDGSTVVFESQATDLVSGDTNSKKDVFYRKTSGGDIKRASISSNGTESDKDSFLNAISASGRYIVYSTTATNLESGPNPYAQGRHYVYDTLTNQNTVLVSYFTNTLSPQAISDDGRFVVAQYNIPGLKDASGAQINAPRVSIYDRELNAWTRLDAPVSGGEQHEQSRRASASCDGSFIVFESGLTNITNESDQNGVYSDIILVDLRNGLRLKNITHQFNGYNYYPNISCNGRYVTFSSTATDMANTSTGQQSPGTHQLLHAYRYDRINETYKFISQTSDGNLMDHGNGSYSTPTDDGQVYFSAKRNVLATPQDFTRIYVRNVDTEITEKIKDDNLQYFYVTQARGALDSRGKKMIFTSSRNDIISTANNSKNQIFLGKLD